MPLTAKIKGVKTGRCALCLHDRALQRSHYLPKSVYRRLRNLIEDTPARPIIVNSDSGKSVSTDFQIWAHLLCKECEGKFSKNGEDLVIPLLRYRTGFLLRDLLCKDSLDNTANSRLSPEINMQALAYFTASMIWRGSVHQWPAPSHRMYQKLGPYQEELRQYLNFESSFPENVIIRIGINTDERDYGTTLPQPMKRLFSSGPHTRQYGFACFDVWFGMSIGKTLEADLVTAASRQVAPVLVQKVSFDKLGIGQRMGDMVRQAPMVN